MEAVLTSPSRTIVLIDGLTIIGRSPVTKRLAPGIQAVQLLNKSVSREHALVTFRKRKRYVFLQDMKSTNGCRVNGQRVRYANLQEGDYVAFGEIVFRFLYRPEDDTQAVWKVG